LIQRQEISGVKRCWDFRFRSGAVICFSIRADFYRPFSRHNESCV